MKTEWLNPLTFPRFLLHKTFCYQTSLTVIFWGTCGNCATDANYERHWYTRLRRKWCLTVSYSCVIRKSERTHLRGTMIITFPVLTRKNLASILSNFLCHHNIFIVQTWKGRQSRANNNIYIINNIRWLGILQSKFKFSVSVPILFTNWNYFDSRPEFSSSPTFVNID